MDNAHELNILNKWIIRTIKKIIIDTKICVFFPMLLMRIQGINSLLVTNPRRGAKNKK